MAGGTTFTTFQTGAVQHVIGTVFYVFNLFFGNYSSLIDANIVIRSKLLEQVLHCDKSFYYTFVSCIDTSLIILSKQIFDIINMDIIFLEKL